MPLDVQPRDIVILSIPPPAFTGEEDVLPPATIPAPAFSDCGDL